MKLVDTVHGKNLTGSRTGGEAEPLGIPDWARRHPEALARFEAAKDTNEGNLQEQGPAEGGASWDSEAAAKLMTTAALPISVFPSQQTSGDAFHLSDAQMTDA